MKLIFYYFNLFLLLLYPQTITILSENESNKLRGFEQSFIEKVFELYEKKTGEKFTLKLIKVKTVFQISLKKLIMLLKHLKRDSILVINKISVTEKRKKKYDFSVPYMTNKYSILTNPKNTLLDSVDIFEMPLKVAFTKRSIYDTMFKSLCCC